MYLSSRTSHLFQLHTRTPCSHLLRTTRSLSREADAGPGALHQLAYLRDPPPSSMNPSSCFVGCRIAGRPRATLSLRSPAVLFRPTPIVHQEFTTGRVQSQGFGVSLARPRPLFLQKHVPEIPSAALARYASQASEPHDEESPTSPPFTAGPYETLTIGIPKESYPGERRVAITPANVKLLLKKGFSRILIERGAGSEAQFTDEAYEQAGAQTVDRRSVFSDSDILLKVRALSIDGPDSEVDAIREGATVISFLYPNQSQNRPTVDRIASRKATAFAMDMVPRISRAQVFDALRYAHSSTRGYLRPMRADMLKVPWQTLLDTRLFWKHRTTSVASLLGR
jgi:NAD(P) transhydrogenase